MSQRIRRSINDIQTHTGKSSSNPKSHEVYMKIGALELQKNRMKMEHQLLLQRIQTLESKMASIEEKKDKYFELINKEKMREESGHQVSHVANPSLSTRQEKAPQEAPSFSDEDGFKLQY